MVTKSLDARSHVIIMCLGAEDMKVLTQHADAVMLFGITCGLSAPYVAGQIDHGMAQVFVLCR